MALPTSWPTTAIGMWNGSCAARGTCTLMSACSSSASKPDDYIKQNRSISKPQYTRVVHLKLDTKWFARSFVDFAEWRLRRSLAVRLGESDRSAAKPLWVTSRASRAAEVRLTATTIEIWFV